MNISTAIRQGNTHEVCQDYAKRFGGVGVVVCDGCTASENSELGAMLLANIFGKASERMSLNENELAIASISEAQSLARYLNISMNCLTTTAIVGRLEVVDGQRRAKVVAYGDGVIIVKYKDGMTGIYNIYFPGNCPFYLRYLLNKSEESNFLSAYDGRYTVRTQTIFPDGSVSLPVDHICHLNGNRYTFSETFSSQDCNEVIICTDGIEHIATKESHQVTYFDVIDIVKHMTQPQKNVKGEFAKRRMKKLFNSLGPNVVTYDDFAFGILNMEDR